MTVVQSNLFQAINTQLKSMAQWLNDNASKQKLGQLFSEDSYVYDFYSWKQTVNTKVVSVAYRNDSLDTGFIIGYYGDLVGQGDPYCPNYTLLEGLPNSNEWISFEFMQNLAKQTVLNYPRYQGISCGVSPGGVIRSTRP